MATDVNIIEEIGKGGRLPTASADSNSRQTFDLEQQVVDLEQEEEARTTLIARSSSSSAGVRLNGDESLKSLNDLFVEVSNGNRSDRSDHSEPIETTDPKTFRTVAITQNNICEKVETESANVEPLEIVDWKSKYILQKLDYDKHLEQIKSVLMQKQSANTLLQREKSILEKEKEEFRKEMDAANKEKESTIIKFAMKEILLLEGKKEKEALDKQLEKARKEIKMLSGKIQGLNDEKNRLSNIIDEKNQDLRKYQRESDKLKTDTMHLESKLKYYTNKLNMEAEAKKAMEKKLEEERNAPHKLEEKAFEKLKVESEAQRIMLRHEISCKNEQIEKLTQETRHLNESHKQLQQQIRHEFDKNTVLTDDLNVLQGEHTALKQSHEAECERNKELQQQLEDFEKLKEENTRNEEELDKMNIKLKELTEKLDGVEEDLQLSHYKEADLLHINKEMSESVVILQNELCLLKSKSQTLEADNTLLKAQKQRTADKCNSLEKQLKSEIDLKHDERLIVAKHLAEQIKLCEMTKNERENILGEYEANKQKYTTMIRELQRELQISNKALQRYENQINLCNKCKPMTEEKQPNGQLQPNNDEYVVTNQASSRTNSCQSSSGGSSSSKPAEQIESLDSLQLRGGNILRVKSPSKRHLVSRILRLQQAVARQTDKIDFLENHALALVAELQKKTKVVQYYMLRDHSGALTSSKSDENKTELAKYGSGVMSAIYGGLKASDAKGMTLELSLEINRKLQAVLEDTLLKNITLKENLDIMGLEVDNLTRQLRHLEAKRA